MQLFGFDTTIQILQSNFGHFLVRFFVLTGQLQHYWRSKRSQFEHINLFQRMGYGFNNLDVTFFVLMIFFIYVFIFVFFNRMKNSEKNSASFG